MITPILMVLPLALQSQVASGAAGIFGAIVKDAATGQILGHLQPAGRLVQSMAGLAGATNPAGLAIELGKGAVQSYQLLRIERLLDTVKLLSTIGAAASVLNLGVSIGGFAMVLHSLKKIDGKLTGLAHAVEKLGQREDAKLVASVQVVLERAEEAFRLADDERRQRWMECDKSLHELAGLLVAILCRSGLPMGANSATVVATPQQVNRLLSEPELMQMVSYLLLVQRARVEALLCLGRPALAADAARQTDAWFSQFPKDPRELVMARASGRTLTGPHLQRVASEAQALSLWLEEAVTSFRQQALLCSQLEVDHVDSLAYVLEVRACEEPQLLYYENKQKGRSGPRDQTAAVA